MASPSPKQPKIQNASPECSHCKHSEAEHARTGTRPCLAMEGDLVTREFCTCDAFRPKIAKAA